MRINFYAGAADAAGRQTVTVDLDGLTAAELTEQLSIGNERLARVLTCCSLLVDGLVVHDPARVIPGDSRVDVLPPFAGG